MTFFLPLTQDFAALVLGYYRFSLRENCTDNSIFRESAKADKCLIQDLLVGFVAAHPFAKCAKGWGTRHGWADQGCAARSTENYSYIH
jgi:hypothetical protein